MKFLVCTVPFAGCLWKSVELESEEDSPVVTPRQCKELNVDVVGV